MDPNQTPINFAEHRERLMDSLTPGQPIEKFKQQKLAQSTNSMKDSGIGTTYLTVSSGSSSTNTSPESEKDALAQNGKAPKPLVESKIDATSTPATVMLKPTQCSRIPEESLHTPSSEAVHATQKGTNGSTYHRSPRDQPALAFSISDQLEMSTPYATRKRGRSIRTNQTAEKERTAEHPWAVPESGKRVQLATGLDFGESVKVEELGQVARRRQRRMHQCEHCDKQFDRPSLLKRHTLTHTGERPFECRFCQKGFSTRSGVNTHERTHTGQRPYVCRICGRRFAAGSNLIFHKYTHSNTRRHQCSQCPKAFVTPGDLRKHEYTHTGQWPFRCAICDRGFATERNLKSHEVTHTGEKPFSCPICHKGYAQESSMKTHMRTHQKSNSEEGDKPEGVKHRPKPSEISTHGPQKSPGFASGPILVTRNQFDHRPIPRESSQLHVPYAGTSPRTVSTPGGANLSSALSPSFHNRSTVDQFRSVPTIPRPDVHHPSAFSTPPRRREKHLEPVVPNPDSAEFAWFYERYKAYYQYYINNLSHQPSAPFVPPPMVIASSTTTTTTTGLPCVAPIEAPTMLPSQTTPLSSPVPWTAAPVGYPSPSPLMLNTIISPGPSSIPGASPNLIHQSPLGVPMNTNRDSPSYPACYAPTRTVNQEHLSAVPSENGALDYTLNTLTKMQQPATSQPSQRG